MEADLRRRVNEEWKRREGGSLKCSLEDAKRLMNSNKKGHKQMWGTNGGGKMAENFEWTGEEFMGYKLYVSIRDDPMGVDKYPDSLWMALKKPWTNGNGYAWTMIRATCGSEKIFLSRKLFDWMEAHRVGGWEEMDDEDDEFCRTREELVELWREEGLKGESWEDFTKEWWEDAAGHHGVPVGETENLLRYLWWSRWEDFSETDLVMDMVKVVGKEIRKEMAERELRGH